MLRNMNCMRNEHALCLSRLDYILFKTTKSHLFISSMEFFSKQTKQHDRQANRHKPCLRKSFLIVPLEKSHCVRRNLTHIMREEFFQMCKFWFRVFCIHLGTVLKTEYINMRRGVTDWTAFSFAASTLNNNQPQRIRWGQYITLHICSTTPRRNRSTSVMSFFFQLASHSAKNAFSCWSLASTHKYSLSRMIRKKINKKGEARRQFALRDRLAVIFGWLRGELADNFNN